MFSLFITFPLLDLEGKDNITSPLISESNIMRPEYVPIFPSIFNPFPKGQVSLIQPIDSLKLPIGVIDFYFGQRKMEVHVSWDWSTITITETVDNRKLQIPLTSSVDWYLKIMQQKTWHTNF